MAKKISSEISIRIRALGIYQIAGGVIGLGLTIWYLPNALRLAIPGLLLLYIMPFVLYSYSIYCGTLLMRSKETGLKHSMINQYLQLVNFSISGYGFQYISGFYVSAGLDLTHSTLFKMNFGVSTWTLQINFDSEMVLININFIALWLILFIDKLMKKVSEHEMNAEFSGLFTKK